MSHRPAHHSTVLLAALLAGGASLLAGYALRHPLPREAMSTVELDYRLDLNHADAATLQLLPGVGPSLADGIVAHRKRLGGYRTIAQLEDVPRLGPATRKRIEPWVILTPAR